MGLRVWGRGGGGGRAGGGGGGIEVRDLDFRAENSGLGSK